MEEEKEGKRENKKNEMKHGHMLSIKKGRNKKLSCELRKISIIVQNDLIYGG